MSTPSRWVAFLRAINVGGHRVTGEELAAVFRSIGLVDVSTFLASGNVVFTSERPDPEPIEAALLEAFGYSVPTMLRSQQQMTQIVEATPFTDPELGDSTVQVMLTRTPVGDSVLDEMEHPDEDRLRVVAGDLFWLPRNGIAASKLNMKAVERVVGPFTVRTIRTMERLSTRL